MFKYCDKYLYSMSMSSCLNRLGFIIVKRSYPLWQTS